VSVIQAATLTREADQATRDIDEHGFALLADALSREQVNAMWDLLLEPAECEADGENVCATHPWSSC
jgi:hypothetical protein